METYQFSVQTSGAEVATSQHALPDAEAARHKATALAAELAVNAVQAGVDGEAVVIAVQTETTGVMLTVRLVFNIEMP